MRHLAIILLVLAMISCNDKSKEIETQIIADFTMVIDEINYHNVHFINTSENALNFIWDFGNGDSSSLENPTYTYASAGIYDVTLMVQGASGSKDTKTQTLVLNEIPDPPLCPLSGNESKTWKLYRVGATVLLGPDSSQPDLWWQGFTNDGSRSCLYKHEFTFKTDMTFEFDDKGGFWGDAQIWPPENPVHESCFEPSAENMVSDNTDLTLWLSGVHSYDFDSSNGVVILIGKGAWLGFPFLGTSSNHATNMPDSVAFKVSFEHMATIDLMTVNFDHGEDGYWTFRYVNYEDWQDEPPLIE